jgi:predicted O-methyltransferase YrrM
MAIEIYTYDWFSWHIPNWTRILEPFRGRPNLKFLEIGSFEGKSACWLLQNILTHETSTLTCIDVFPDMMGGEDEMMPRMSTLNANFDHNIRATGVARKVTKMKGTSEELLRTLPALIYDFIYIDGSHQAPYVLTDTILSWYCLKIGGYLCLDDYLWAPEFPPNQRPQMSVDAFLQVFEGMYEPILIDYQVFIRKTESLKPWI